MKKTVKVFALLLALVFVLSNYAFAADDTVVFEITEGNAAYINSSSTQNGIALAADGYNYLYVKSTDTARLFYRINASSLAGKKVGKAVLKFYADRNYSGDPTFNVYKVTGDWKSDEISKDNLPSYDETYICQKKYSNATGAENPIPNSGYTLIELDITKAFESIPQNGEITVMLNSVVWSGNGTKIAGINYTNYKPVIECSNIMTANTVSFYGGADAQGSVNSVSEVAGATVTLPENGFTRAGYEFIGWGDGTSVYSANDTYTVPQESITLNAVWKYTGEYTLSVPADMVGYYSSEGKALDVSTHNGLNEKASGPIGRLLYRIDASSLADKNVGKAVLKFYANRNYNGDPDFVVNKVTGSWMPGTLSDCPNFDATAIGSVKPKLDNTKFLPVEIDITSAFKDISSDGYVNIMLRAIVYNNNYTLVGGVSNKDYAPQIYITEADNTAFFTGNNANGSETYVTEISNGYKTFTGHAIISEDLANSFTTAVPIMAVYDVSSGNEELADVVFGDSVTFGENNRKLSVTVDADNINSTSVIKFFVFNSKDNIIPLISKGVLR